MYKKLAIFLTICVISSMTLPMSYADDSITKSDITSAAIIFSDVNGHWASKAISKWAERGIVKGDNRGFRPNDFVTKGEMAAILDNLMGYQIQSKNSFADVKKDAWYEDAILKANAAGILNGDGAGHANPSSNITREQAAVMLARAFGVDESSGNQTSFKDAGNISFWAQSLVFGMEADKYIGGMNDGNFSPKANITRAQVVTIIDNAVQAYYTTAGTYTNNVDSNIAGSNCLAIVKANGVTIKGAKINGDLIIAEGVAKGSVTLDATVIKGKLIARGGGENSIHIVNGAAVNGRVSVEKIDGVIRIVSDGVVIANLDANTEVILEGNFTNVVVSEGASVEVRGQVANVDIEAKAKVTVSKGAKVDSLIVEKKAEGAKVEVAGTLGHIRTDAPKTEVFASETAKITKVEATETATGTDISIDKKAEVKILDSSASVTTSGNGKPQSVTGTGTVKPKQTGGVQEGSVGGGGGAPGGGPAEGGASVPSEKVMNLTFKDEDVDKNEIGGTLRWNIPANVSNITGYTIYASQNETTKGTLITTTAVNVSQVAIQQNTAYSNYFLVVCKNISGEAATFSAIKVSDVVNVNHYAIVKESAVPSGFFNAQVRLMTADGVTKTYTISNTLNNKAQKGQIVDYELNESGEIIDMDSTNAAISVPTGLKMINNKELNANNTNYLISDRVVVFTYDGTAPNDPNCDYNINSIKNMKYNKLISSPASVYLDEQGIVEALLVPQSSFVFMEPKGLNGIKPTSTADNDGMITGVDDTMEYRHSSETTYSAITGSAVTGLSAGTYYVRYAANGDYDAGPVAIVAIPEYVVANQFGIVEAFDNGMLVPKLRLFTSTGETRNFDVSLHVEAARGQIVFYGANSSGEIEAMDSTDAAISVATGLNILTPKELKIGSTSYTISDHVVVFTYNGTAPNDPKCDYNISSINNIEYNKPISSSASIYLDKEGIVSALLVPYSLIKI